MLVYRLEDKDGYGPLSGQSHRDSLGRPDMRNNINHHKEPYDLAAAGKCSHPVDAMNGFLWNCANRFAWQTLEHMIGFCRFPRSFDDAGFYVIVYEVNDDDKMVRFDDGQVIFNRDEANPVGGFLLSRASSVFFENYD